MTIQSAIDQYYAAFEAKSDFSEVPLDADVAFRGPMNEIAGEAALRPVLAGLAQRVSSLAIRHQMTQGDQVLTVYDFDLGLPDGPIPMAERIALRAGVIREIELFFDARRLTA